MRKIFAAVLLTAGFLLVTIGTVSYLYFEENAKLNDKITEGNYSGVLDYTAALRAKPWFFALKVFPSLYGNFLMKEGWSLYKVGDFEGSLKKFHEVLKINGNPYQSSALFNAATINLSPETVESAVADYQKVLAREEGNIPAQRNLEILNKMKEEQGGLRGGTTNADGEDKGKNRSRTKDKFEYRDSDSKDGSSSVLRY